MDHSVAFHNKYIIVVIIIMTSSIFLRKYLYDVLFTHAVL